MFVTPTIPNLLDYLAFLRGSAGITQSAVLPSASGTATGGSTTTLVDTTQSWTTNPQQWAGAALYDATQSLTASVESNSATTLTFTAALPVAVAAGDSYTVMDGQILTSLEVALEIVNEAINCASARVYTLAVYNLATDRLVNFAADQTGQTFFADLRTKLHIDDLRVGVASSANDQGTSVGILNPDQMRLLTLQDLQTLKTPWGRQYMAFAQTYGRTIWGLT